MSVSFEGAHRAKIEANRRQEEDQLKWNEERENRIQSKLQAIILRHQNELSAMKKIHNRTETSLQKNLNMEIEQ